MNVLYVNHTEVVSGGERSLLGLIDRLPTRVHPLVACPPGALQRAAAELGVPVTSITGTAGSLRLHPLHTPRAVAQLARAGVQVARASRRHRAELVHANSIRAGIVLALAPATRAARVVHVRDCLPPGAVSTATMRLIAARATTIIANSRYTAASVEALAPGAHTEVVHNGVDLGIWDPERIDRARARGDLGQAGRRGLLLGVVAQLSPWKGQDTAVEALRLLREDGIDAHLLLIGSAKFVARATRFDNEAYVARLRATIAGAGLEDRVSWLGEREDVPQLMRALDVLLLPSWEEPFGRALIEAMALGVPVVSTDVGGPPEIVQDGQEGLLVPPREPQVWADAIRRLAAEPALAARMGRAGRATATNRFGLDTHVARTLSVYDDAVSRRA